MSSQRRRLVWYVTGLVGVVLGYTPLYEYGMSAWVGRPVDVLHALVIVIETFTTTGYGEDAPLGIDPDGGTDGVHGAHRRLRHLPDATAVRRIVGHARVATSVPTAADRSDHVVICHFSSRAECLVEELESWDQPFVVVEADRDRAGLLHERGLTVVHGDPEAIETLKRASAPNAAALVADASDEVNPSIVLSARELSDDFRVIAFAEEPEMVDHLRYVGADEVFSPRQLLGATLARQVTTSVTAELGSTVEIGDDFDLVELPVQPQSELAGGSLAESGIRERTVAPSSDSGTGASSTHNPRPTPS